LEERTQPVSKQSVNPMFASREQLNCGCVYVDSNTKKDWESQQQDLRKTAINTMLPALLDSCPWDVEGQLNSQRFSSGTN
jgi:hypothetical protein